MIQSVNPATGQAERHFEAFTLDEVEEKVRRAASAAAVYRTTSFADRAIWMLKAAQILESESAELGKLMTREMGKTFASAVSEAEKCASVCRYYAEKAEEMLSDEPVNMGSEEEAWIAFQPLGVVLAVMPWNFPFWQVFRFAAPALMAGNVGLLKHASNVPQSALAIEDVFRRAGFPNDVFQTLLIGSEAVEALVEDARIAAVTLTGSEGAGRAVASTAGRSLKKAVMELGGSDPFIVMPGADLEAAVSAAVAARMINNGQSCIAAKRFIVHKDIIHEFESRFIESVKSLVVGDPMEEATDIGPLATEPVLKDLEKQVEKTIAMGAKLRFGGKRLDRPGNFYQPTVLTNIPPGSPAATEELFGPVAPIIEATDISDSIRIANSTTFGLGAAAWTKDEAEQRRFIDEIESGTIVINGTVVSHPNLPFGGIKNSGFGRELSYFGIREFVNVKTVRLQSNRAGARAGTE